MPKVVNSQEHELCRVHQKDLDNLKAEMKTHKSEIHDLLDDLRLDLLEQMKPPLTKGQMITLLLAMVTYISLSVGFVNKNRQDIKVNTADISNVKEYQNIENAKVDKKLDKIYDVLLEMNKK